MEPETILHCGVDAALERFAVENGNRSGRHASAVPATTKEVTGIDSGA